MAKRRTGRNAHHSVKESAEGNAAFSGCHLEPMKIKRARSGIATVIKERAGGGTGGFAGGTDGHLASLSIARLEGKVEQQIRKFHERKGENVRERERESEQTTVSTEMVCASETAQGQHLMGFVQLAAAIALKG